MKFRRMAAGIAALAISLGGLAFGAGTAMAEDGDSLPTLGNTLTIKADSAEQIAGRTFEAYQLATYTPHTALGSVSVTTAPKNRDVIATAMANITADSAEADRYDPASDGDPMAWALQKEGRLSATNTDGSAGDESPWDNTTRELAGQLDSMRTQLQGAATRAVAGQGATEVTLTLTPGLYYVVDATGKDVQSDATWTRSLSMIASTAVTAKVKGATGAAETKQLADGIVLLKNQSVPIYKQVVKEEGKDYVSQEKPDYAVGDDVHYELTSQVPVFTGYELGSRVLRIIDTMSRGLTYREVTGVTVTKGDTTQTLKPGTDYTVTTRTLDRYEPVQPEHTAGAVKDGAATEVTIDFANYVNRKEGAQELLEGGIVTVILRATVNADAVVSTPGSPQGNPNKVDLEFGNDSTEEIHRTPGGEVNVYTFRFQLLKTDHEGKPLAGATFIVKSPKGWLKTAPTAGEDGKTGTGWTVTQDEDEAMGFTSDSTGMIDGLDGLAAGTYTVKETKAPEGFQSLVLPEFSFTITPAYDPDTSTQRPDSGTWGDHVMTDVTFSDPSGDMWKLVTKDGQVAFQYDVENVPSIQYLPKTGAAGAILFSAITLLAGGAALLLYVQSRRTARARRIRR